MIMSNIKNISGELLRLSTAGSVDDGKSTLIGRLLYDSKSILVDQMEAIEKASQRKGLKSIDLSLLTDGLRDEREQGITIDVAYRYFSTPNRSFIIADTPGHVQYTRNMVTGASTANLAIILVDVRKGMVEQTCRHACISDLLGIPHIFFCVNKMDLIDYQQEEYDRVCGQIAAFCTRLNAKDIRFFPISALHGDNVVSESVHISWYKGGTLFHALEKVHIGSDENLRDCRFPVQGVIRPKTDDHHDYRSYTGRVAGGVLKPGDDVVVLPSGFETKIMAIELGGKQIERAFPPMSVNIVIKDNIDIGRGDMLARPNNQPKITQDIDCTLCWFSTKPLKRNSKYILKHTTQEVQCVIKEVLYLLDIEQLQRLEVPEKIGMNDIVRIRLRTSKPIMVDSYVNNRHTGSFILIDENGNDTMAAGMIKV
jgi:sulfate adenylyltransferase subunit 1